MLRLMLPSMTCYAYRHYAIFDAIIACRHYALIISLLLLRLMLLLLLSRMLIIFFFAFFSLLAAAAADAAPAVFTRAARYADVFAALLMLAMPIIVISADFPPPTLSLIFSLLLPMLYRATLMPPLLIC